jgi:serine/threonine protein kinase
MTEVFASRTPPVSVFPTSPHALPVGARIGEFEVHRLIGEGGFGIVYLCYDQALDRFVALKEYMPSSLATRVNTTLAIAVKSGRHQETFDAGLKSFINEARLLAQFDHPSLLKVYRFWQANGTAYMTMPYYEGPTLKQALAALTGPPDEATLRSWLLPMLDALEEIHRARCYHRDIAPDNILLTNSGPLLLDFGAARRVIGDMTQALTVVLKPGFAPIEQYGDAATMSQGAWTDLYALASVVHFAITGRPPMSAVDRMMDDRLEPLSHRVAGRYSHALLATVDTALSLRPQDRPQSVAAFRTMLNATPDEQTADLHLWGDDDVPTELDSMAATIPGALGDASFDEPRTVPTLRRTNDSPAPALGLAAHEKNASILSAEVPDSGLGAMPLPNRSVLAAQHARADVIPAMPVTAPVAESVPLPAPRAAALSAATVPDDPPRTQFVPRSSPAAAVGSGAGLAPLSGGHLAAENRHKLGVPASQPPRPPMDERTAMPSLLPDHAPWQPAATPPARDRQTPLAPQLVADKKPALSWTLGLSVVAVALIVAAVAWNFSRPDAAPSGPVIAVPTPTPAQAPEPAATQSPTPSPAPVKTADPVVPETKPVATPRAGLAQATPPARPAESGQGAAFNSPLKDTPAIRLGNPSSSRAEGDSPIVLPRSSPAAAAPAATPMPAKLEPTPSPAIANPGAGPRSIARCADIRQRAGLEDLTTEERQFLRTQCR